MKNILSCLILAFAAIIIAQPCFAEPNMVAVRVTPSQIISTKKAGNVEIGDVVRFKTVSDAYKNDKLYISKGAIVSGKIGYIHENGFAGDSAQIQLENLKTKSVDDKIVAIPVTYTITGDFTLATQVKHVANEIISWVFLLPIIRGTEIYLVPDKNFFNIAWNE